MTNLAILKKISAILLSSCFLVNCLMVPFCNFQDTVSTKILYTQFLQTDSDGDVLEFITNNILHIGSLFDDEDDDEVEPHQQNHASQQQPVQPLQITPGFLFCTHSLAVIENEQPAVLRVFCSFTDDNYKLDFSSFVFHPPSVTGC